MSESTRGYALAEIAERLGGRLVGDGSVRITGVAPLAQARPGDITLLASDKRRYLERLAECEASAIVLADADLAPGRAAVVVDSPGEAFDAVLGMFPAPQSPPAPGVHPAAVVDDSAELAEGVAVGPGAVIQAHVTVGANSVVWPNVFVGRDCRIGSDCELHPGVVLREQTELGDRVIVHANAVLGADGYGYRQVNGRHVKIPQVGRVVVGDDVEIGANATIDRAKFGATRVGNGCKIDNLTQIAHNVQVGEHCLIMALCGVAGSSELGHHVMLAGQVGVIDNVVIGAGTIVTAGACVLGDAPGGAVLGGWHAQDHRASLRQTALTRRLPELFERVRKLEASE